MLEQKLLGNEHGFFFRKRCALGRFRQRVAERMERTVGLQNDGKLLRLGVAEVSDAPQRSGDARGVNPIDLRNAHAPVKVLVDNRIGRVHELRGFVEAGGIERVLAHDRVGA